MEDFTLLCTDNHRHNSEACRLANQSCRADIKGALRAAVTSDLIAEGAKLGWASKEV